MGVGGGARLVAAGEVVPHAEELQVVDARVDVEPLDVTGGAPELNPHFRYLVASARASGVHVMDRCNLTILEQPGHEDLAQFLTDHDVEIVASLPCYLETNVDAQRGKGVFEASIRCLQLLNRFGYGKHGSGLALNLVYNPQGASLPPPQGALEADLNALREQPPPSEQDEGVAADLDELGRRLWMGDIRS